MINTQTRTLRGFTLIELLVTMAIFITIITIATGALFSAQAINVKLEQTQVILDEVNLAMEVMVRDVRYGTTFYCTTSLPGTIPANRQSCGSEGGSVLLFRPAVQLTGSTDHIYDRVAYYVTNGVLFKSEYPYGGTSRTLQMTSSSVSVSKLNFFDRGVYSASGAGGNDLNQPLITVVLAGATVPLKPNVPPVSFSVQTSASSREIDN